MSTVEKQKDRSGCHISTHIRGQVPWRRRSSEDLKEPRDWKGMGGGGDRTWRGKSRGALSAKRGCPVVPAEGPRAQGEGITRATLMFPAPSASMACTMLPDPVLHV